MANNKIAHDRIDMNFKIDMKNIARIRLAKGLAKMKPTELSLPEMTRLLRRCENYPKCLEELRTKPKTR